MTSPLLPLIGVLLLSTPTSSAQPTPPTNPAMQTTREGEVPLRAHILEMPGIQWRADLLDGLEYVEQAGSYTVWKADAATLKRLVEASADCQPAGTANGVGSAQRIHYVASLKRMAQVTNGRTTSVSFMPAVGNILNGLELDSNSEGIRAPGGVLADVTIRGGWGRRHSHGATTGASLERIAEHAVCRDAPGTRGESPYGQRPMVDTGRRGGRRGSGSSRALQYHRGRGWASRAGRRD